MQILNILELYLTNLSVLDKHERDVIMGTLVLVNNPVMVVKGDIVKKEPYYGVSPDIRHE